MRFSIFIVLQLSITSTLAFWPHVRSLSASPLARAFPAQANAFDYTSKNSAAARAAARAAQTNPWETGAHDITEQFKTQVLNPPQEAAWSGGAPSPDAFTEGYAHQPQAQPVPQRAATGPDAEDLAIAAAVASATAVLRSGNIQVTHATVERIIAGFADKIWDEAPLSPGAAAVPSRMPPPAEAPMAMQQSQQQQQQPPAGQQWQQPPQPPPLQQQQQQQHNQYGYAQPQSPGTAPPESTGGLNKQALTQVLIEFMESDYVRRLCDECNVQPMIGSPPAQKIGLMFESVRLEEAKLTITLKKVFEIRSVKLLEHLVKFLRPRFPELKRLQYEAKSPPSTRLIIVSP